MNCKLDLIQEKLSNIESLLLEIKLTPTRENSKNESWLDLKELCDYHPDKPSKATVYGWVSSGLIPVHKTGKRLRFHKTEIDGWLELGKKRTTSEICRDAANYVGKRKGGK